MYRIMLSLLYLLLICNASLYSQRNKPSEDSYFVFDENWQGTTIEKAKYLARQKKISDTCWQWDTYNFAGPLMRTENFKDEKGSIAHGRFIIYNAKGRMDSICNYSNGVANGTWYIFNDTGRVATKLVYDRGKLLSVVDAIKEDSINEKQKDTNAVLAKVEIESEYPGKLSAWAKYLNSNLKYPERALNFEKQGNVVIQFIVDTEGKIEDPAIYQSVEFSLDEEALRIIRNSKKWIPANQNGKKVKSYKRQPIYFRLS